MSLATDSYRRKLDEHATRFPNEADALIQLMSQQERNVTRFFYSNVTRDEQPQDVAALLSCVSRDTTSDKKAVCVIENVSPVCIETIGSAWDLDPSFFARHASNPTQSELWGWRDWKTSLQPSTQQHLDGIYEYHNMKLDMEKLRCDNVNYCKRHIFQDTEWPVNVSTRVSYCRPFPRLYLFLVDATIKYENAITQPTLTRLNPTLRFTYSGNYGGVLLPALPGSRLCELFPALASVFQHYWQIEYIHESNDVFANVPLLYVLCNSLWESNLRNLNQQINHISFHSIRNPNLAISDSLHDIREDLVHLTNSVDETILYARPSTANYLQSIPVASAIQSKPRDSLARLADINKRAEKLHGFLMETFQLLVNTVAVRDSQYSIQQAEEALKQTQQSLKQTEQSVFLTRLAAVYLPLSVTTGLFGMNLQEINGAVPRVWAFIIVVVGLTVLTFGAFGVGRRGFGSAQRREAALERRSVKKSETA